ncbi:hypothetical protein EV193_106402 [Herbihabitans rhizosphaerae]|uniref:Uncharacterized protein n=1 Tax=Herbihabitans rhizosphaerae TaxID=1872711 RepID=A0A4Q7KLN5_9PSEU|nr:hypothetical protein [Herbihabitans rhizosphaerae]RZS37164.1 hypothetical protein EV193_106402 [Herbihabitans rhizosphaerae]
MMIVQNYGISSWRDARMAPWHLLLVLGASAVFAVAGWLLGRLGPDERPSGDESPRPTTRLLPAVVVASGLISLGTLLWAPAVVAVPVVISVLIVAVLGTMLGSVSGAVNDQGFTVRLGWLGQPRWRFPLSGLERAWAEQRRPARVGGWGFRGLPGDVTVMLRGGDCWWCGTRAARSSRSASTTRNAAPGCSTR